MAAEGHGAVRRWEVFELTLPGPETGNPFTEVQLGARFVLGAKAVTVDGFYDGTGSYKIRSAHVGLPEHLVVAG